MKKSNLNFSLNNNQMIINHGCFNQIFAQFYVKTFNDGKIETQLIIEHIDYRVKDLLIICEKLGLKVETEKSELSCKCITKVLGLPYDGLGESVRNAFQIVWDYYQCF